MAETHVGTRSELLTAIDREWLELQSVLARLDEDQMTGTQDAAGWTVQDHLNHIAAWERSVVYFLQGKARHVGLDIDEEIYLRGDEDEINALIQRRTAGMSPSQTQEDLQSVHQQLLTLLQRLSDEDLHRRYRSYLPDEPGEGDGPPAIDVIYGNSAGHYREHLVWMAALLARGLPM